MTATERELMGYLGMKYSTLPPLSDEEKALFVSFLREGRKLDALSVSERIISEYIGRQLKNTSSITLAVIGEDYINKGL
jgi:hypothetical protein